MRKRKKISLTLAVTSLMAVAALLGWFVFHIFEGERPQVVLSPLPPYLNASQEFSLNLSDTKRGLKYAKVSVEQGGREYVIVEERFPFQGFSNAEGTHTYHKVFSIDPVKMELPQGRIDLKVYVRDYSRRSGGDGNLNILHHTSIVDTIPPSIRALSRLHYVRRGGAGLVLHQASSDTVESGLFVGESFFPSFPLDQESKKGVRAVYFAVPRNIEKDPAVYLWAKDRAGNTSEATFYYKIRKKTFRSDRITITDGFLKKVLPYFSFYSFDAEKSDLEKFLTINTKLRQENHETIYGLRLDTDPRRLWEGPWLRMKNAATMAGFGDRRTYYHKGKKIDEQLHLGVDLASLANSEVQAANSGRVIFAERLGIYGNTVVLDHGQGVQTLYSHLSLISVNAGEEVAKGHVIGFTGRTGLAGGDHLHFAVMMSGVPVNPVEWWDKHWLHDNILRKLAMLDSAKGLPE